MLFFYSLLSGGIHLSLVPKGHFHPLMFLSLFSLSLLSSKARTRAWYNGLAETRLQGAAALHEHLTMESSYATTIEPLGVAGRYMAWQVTSSRVRGCNGRWLAKRRDGGSVRMARPTWETVSLRKKRHMVVD